MHHYVSKLVHLFIEIFTKYEFYQLLFNHRYTVNEIISYSHKGHILCRCSLSLNTLEKVFKVLKFSEGQVVGANVQRTMI